jgi:hypothetical protein
MKNSQLLSGIVFLIGSFVCSHATAEVYKCTSFDKKTGQKKTSYTDAACADSAKQTLIEIQETSNLADNVPLTDDAELDLRVSRAVLKHDFKLAKSLAMTKEHWRLISMAEGTERQQVRTVATSPVVIARSTRQDECTLARNDFEFTSRTQWRHKDSIAAKKSIMYAACGISDPEYRSRPIVLVQPYGGVIQSSRWVAPRAYHRPYNKYHGKHDLRHSHNRSGLSLYYKSKHFGLDVKSFRSQGRANIKHQFR